LLKNKYAFFAGFGRGRSYKSDEGESSIVQNDSRISLVPKHKLHSLPQQERFARRKNSGLLNQKYLLDCKQKYGLTCTLQSE
jgi:hypothetical protein